MYEFHLPPGLYEKVGNVVAIATVGGGLGVAGIICGWALVGDNGLGSLVGGAIGGALSAIWFTQGKPWEGQ